MRMCCRPTHSLLSAVTTLAVHTLPSTTNSPAVHTLPSATNLPAVHTLPSATNSPAVSALLPAMHSPTTHALLLAMSSHAMRALLPVMHLTYCARLAWGAHTGCCAPARPCHAQVMSRALVPVPALLPLPRQGLASAPCRAPHAPGAPCSWPPHAPGAPGAPCSWPCSWPPHAPGAPCSWRPPRTSPKAHLPHLRHVCCAARAHVLMRTTRMHTCASIKLTHAPCVSCAPRACALACPPHSPRACTHHIRTVCVLCPLAGAAQRRQNLSGHGSGARGGHRLGHAHTQDP